MKKTMRKLMAYVAVMLFITTGCYGGVKNNQSKEKEYKYAIEVLENGSLRTASTAFEKLGRFKDSEILYNYCKARESYNKALTDTYSIAYNRIALVPDDYKGFMSQDILMLKSDITITYRNYIDEKIRYEEQKKAEELMLTMLREEC